MNSNILDTRIDKTQKRILAFVNHFVISSCSFLNDFASKCEAKFIEVERKVQKVEASLIIIEAKLSSIPDPHDSNKNPETVINDEISPAAEMSGTTEANDEVNRETQEQPPAETGVKACEDERYKKFFKMLQFGVPPDAVRMKMRAEGVDPAVLSTPELILADGVTNKAN